MYAQDHVTLGSFAFDLGLRWDQFDVVNTYAQVSPRAGIAYHVRRTGTVLHAAYNRFFSPPPIEYLTLANFLGTTAPDPDQRVGDVRPYRQHYFEVGVTQPAGEHVVLEVSAYRHYGDDSYENTELGDTRLFLPTNFASARSGGVEFAVNFRQFQHTGFSARLQYAAARTYFYGPIAGGFTGGELIDAGERILPAFDQIHTGTIGLMYRHKWRGLWTGLNTGFGSGTPFHEGESRLPGHVVFDLAGGLDLWRHEHGKVSFEFDAINIGNRVYAIAKESETTPLQYAPRRVISGRLRWSF